MYRVDPNTSRNKFLLLLELKIVNVESVSKIVTKKFFITINFYLSKIYFYDVHMYDFQIILLLR